MEENEGIFTYSGKVKQKSSRNKNRPTPYSKSNRNKRIDLSERDVDESKGLIGKVTNLIVPTWISSWWKPDSVKDNDENSNDSIFEETESRPNGELPSQMNLVNLENKASLINADQATVKPDILSNLSQKTIPDVSSSRSLLEPEMAPLETNKRKVSESEESKEDDVTSNSIFGVYRTRKTSAASSRPTFKVSAFKSPVDLTSNVSFDTSALNASSFDFSAQRSPFYTGGTTFGGASSFRESSGKRIKLSPVSNKVRTTRTQMKAKPLLSSKKNVVTSQTAKRILITLGKMSSPVKDSKRIPPSIFDSPSFSEMMRNKVNRSDNKTVAPPTKTISSIKPDLVKTFQNKRETFKRFNEQSTIQKPALFNSKPVEPTSFEQQKDVTKPVLPTQTVPAPITAFKPTMKMKREKTSTTHFSSNIDKDEVVNTMPEITSAGITLPITALPKFNFTVNSSQQTHKPVMPIFSPSINVTPIPKITKQPIKEKPTPPKPKSPVKPGNFIFTTPEVVQKVEERFATPANKGFAFSSPIDLIKKAKEKLDQPAIKDTSIKPFKILQKLTKPEGSWDCSTCFIVNKKEDIVCVACGASNPQEPETIKGPISESTPSFPIPEPQTKFPIRTLNLPKLDEGSWSCPTCFIDNKKDTTHCASCTTTKPNSNVCEVKKLSSFVTKVDPGSWSCPVCMIDNKANIEVCAACKEPNPNSKQSTSSSNQSEQLFKIKFGQSNSNTWSCPTCMIDNDNALTNCAACTESKPGSKMDVNSSNGISNNILKTNIDSASSKFGVNNTSSGFQFGNSGSAGGFNFGSKKSFEFGNNNIDSGFKFGNNESRTGFNFGTSGSAGFSFKKPTAEPKQESSSGFGAFIPNRTDTISISKDSSETHAVQDPLEVKSAFSSIAEAAKLGFLNVEGVSDPKSPSSAKKDAPDFGNKEINGFADGKVFSLGSSNASSLFKVKESTMSTPSVDSKTDASSSAAASSFSFGLNAKSNAPISAPAPSFNFGSSAKTDAPSLAAAPTFNFGSSAITNASSSTAAPSFNFGSNVKTDTLSSAAAPSFNFGSSAKTDAPSSAAAQTFNFGSSAITNASSSTAAPSFNFGSIMKTDTLSSAAAPSFNFGSSAKTDAPCSAAAPSFNFGSSAITNASSSTAAPSFNFGSSSKTDASSSAAAPSFNFSSSAKTDASSSAAVPSFGFGSSVKNDASSSAAALSFNFGSSTKTDLSSSAAAPILNFGPSDKNDAGLKPKTILNFGSSNNSTSSGLNDDASKSVFGNAASKLSTSIFGSGPSQPLATFNFGTSSALPTFETKATGFSLSSVNSSAPENNGPQSTGFSFTSGSTSLFNMGTNNKRIFETDNKMFGNTATGAFSAGAGSPSRRPIKKAIRRKK